MEVLVNNNTNNRRDKQDLILQDFLRARNWKQALTHCEKRLKKGEKSEGLLINKAHILLSFPDPARNSQGSEELRAILDRKPAIADINLLSFIEAEAIRRGDGDPRIASIWDRAVSENPNDEKLQEVWFKFKFQRQDYKAAQKAAMVYQKNFPDKRQPFFWAIVSCYLASTVPDAPEVDKRLFGPLAYRWLLKAVANVPANNKGSDSETHVNGSKQNETAGLTSQIRALRCPEDLHMLVEIYRRQEKAKEALAILNDPRTGILSEIGRAAWDLVLEKIDLYEECELWEEAWHFCCDLLVDALPDNAKDAKRTPVLPFGQLGDDWKVWSALLKSEAMLYTEKKQLSTREMIQIHLLQNPTSRNAGLASILFESSTITIPKKSDQNLLLKSCLNYFGHQSVKPVCYRDLSRSVHLLNQQNQVTFLEWIATHARNMQPIPESLEKTNTAWITSEINSLKLDYSLIVAKRENLDSTTLLESFIANCLRLYKLSLRLGSNLPISERRPGDDTAILAAMGFVHLFKRGQKSALLRSAVVLEILLQHSKHNYDAILMIVRIYIYLGAVTQAVEHYLKLDIKHIQHQTVSWVLFTRISSIHPHTGSSRFYKSGREPFNPSKMLQAALAWAIRNEEQLRSGSTKYLDHDAYYNLIDHLKLVKASENSITKYMLIIELQRIKRLRHSDDIEDYHPILESMTADIEDLRDRKAFPDCEPNGQARFEEYLRQGPMPGPQWLAAQLAPVILIGGLKGTLRSTASRREVIHTLEEKHTEVADVPDLTFEESEMKYLGQNLVVLLACLLSSTLPEHEEESARICSALLDRFDNSQRSMCQMVETSLDNKQSREFNITPQLGIPDFHYFHGTFMLLDQCAILMDTMNLMIPLNKDAQCLSDAYFKSRLAGFREASKRLNEALSREARELQKLLQGRQAFDALVTVCLGEPTDELGLVMRSLVDKPWMEHLARVLLESWQEGLDGIMRTKI